MIIAGANGFAKEVMELIFQMKLSDKLVFFDDVTPNLEAKLFNEFPILRSSHELKEYIQKSSPLFTLGLGTPKNRKLLKDKIESMGGKLTSIISTNASIGKYGIQIGEGVNIMQGVILTSNVKIGEGALININVTIGHDSIIGQYSEICPGVNISGNCTIGDYTFIGTNATILPGVKIGSNVVVGASSLVTKDVPDNTTIYGVPAKPKEVK